ncbi:MAG TPA: hypothetical protein PKD78_02710, partial [Saprospiraceae bacterium]|nr:hypothetical protein [Saprospiraceae bacterium]
MHLIDWIVLIGTLAFVVLYGLWKTRNDTHNPDDFLAGKHDLRWWTIGLSIMATQASAITFLSTPGQGFNDGMQFVQFYFGMPLAMIFLSVFVLPVYYRLRVTTAYEYLEDRFDVRMRTLAAGLFLIQRGVAAAISIYAPSIILSAVFGWSLELTNVLMCVFVIIYTTSGGSSAVSRTQELQMTIMLGGLVTAFLLVLWRLPEGVGLTEAWQIAGATGKTQVVDWGFPKGPDGARHFDWSDRYNIWSGIIGAGFLFLSYFGTDQSQVGRYLSGKSLKESRFGLLFNGFVKIPMQFLVLAVGVMVYVFFQYNHQPLHFNTTHLEWVAQSGQEATFARLEQQNDSLFEVKQATLAQVQAAIGKGDEAAREQGEATLKDLDSQRQKLRFQAKEIIYAADPARAPEVAALKAADPAKYRAALNDKYKDTDFVFIHYVLRYIPQGLIGLLLAMIFCASWSTTASELSALTATSVSDLYRRLWAPHRDDEHYYRVSRWATVLWGVFIIVFAIYADLFDNLIQAVNMIGSIFYGTILGIFFTAFFLKRVGGVAVFWAAVLTQVVVARLFFGVSKDPYLWYNPLGCLMVMSLSTLF